MDGLLSDFTAGLQQSETACFALFGAWLESFLAEASDFAEVPWAAVLPWWEWATATPTGIDQRAQAAVAATINLVRRIMNSFSGSVTRWVQRMGTL
ncbi:MAG: hypothetical protein VKN33_10370 [Candidatus Sericytochromatia bacterium]|nr:hypothetical protein [Candidatus Sericytochromatia bacterium]